MFVKKYNLNLPFLNLFIFQSFQLEPLNYFLPYSFVFYRNVSIIVVPNWPPHCTATRLLRLRLFSLTQYYFYFYLYPRQAWINPSPPPPPEAFFSIFEFLTLFSPWGLYLSQKKLWKSFFFTSQHIICFGKAFLMYFYILPFILVLKVIWSY